MTNKTIISRLITITTICSTCDLSGLWRLYAPDDVLVVLGAAEPVAVGSLPVLSDVRLGREDVTPSETEPLGVLVSVPVGENAVTTYSFVPKVQEYVHPLTGVEI
tara:strand:+ start:1212 stop:1526 length:315 start_codon:yes stop_codon:yes gene_type:complete